MLAFVSLTPIGVGEHLSEPVARAIRVIKESGLPYQTTAMGTLVEGEWDEVMGVIRRCCDALHEHADRVSCLIKIDDWRGRTGQLRAKVAAVERVLGEEVVK